MKKCLAFLLTLTVLGMSVIPVSAAEVIKYDEISGVKRGDISADEVISDTSAEIESPEVVRLEAKTPIVAEYPFEVFLNGSLVSEFKGLSDAVDYIVNTLAETEAEIKVVGDYNLTNTDSCIIPADKHIAVTSDIGATLYYTSLTGAVFTVEDSGELDINGNLIINGDTSDGAEVTTFDSFITVLPNGNLTLGGGLIIKNLNSYTTPTTLNGVVVNNRGNTTIGNCTVFNNYGNSIIYNRGTVTLTDASASIQRNNLNKDWTTDYTLSTNDILITGKSASVVFNAAAEVGEIAVASSGSIYAEMDLSDIEGSLVTLSVDSLDNLSIAGAAETDLTDKFIVRSEGVIYTVDTKGNINYANVTVYDTASSKYNAVLSAVIPSSVKADTLEDVGFYLFKSATDNIVEEGTKTSISEIGAYGIFSNQMGEDSSILPQMLTEGEASGYVFGLVVEGLASSSELYWAEYYTTTDGETVIGSTHELFDRSSIN